MSSGGFTASRTGDGGNRLAAGEILPPFCVSGGIVAAIGGKVGEQGVWRNCCLPSGNLTVAFTLARHSNRSVRLGRKQEALSGQGFLRMF